MKFGTDGVRGRAGVELTPEIACRIGFGAARALVPDDSARQSAVFLVGKDPRLSSDMLEAAICSGVTMSGADALTTGIAPTPFLPFILGKRSYAGGFMITASHNPIGDNGIKVFGSDGTKIEKVLEKQVERSLNGRPRGVERVAPYFGDSSGDSRLVGVYANSLKKLLSTYIEGAGRRWRKRRLQLVFDCAWGATSEVCRKVFAGFPSSPRFINAEFRGDRINLACGSTDLSQLKDEVVNSKADIGFAFDGDGDRVLVVDSEGKEVDGDKIIGALAVNEPVYRKSGGVVVTVMSNLGLEEYLGAGGIEMHRVKVGDKFVFEGLKKRGLILGGEQSGHIIMLDKGNSGDGILTAVSVVGLILSTGKSIEQLTGDIPIYPQYLENVPVARKAGWNRDGKLSERLMRIEDEYKGRVRLLVRPSGTEPVIRVMTESKSRNRAKKVLREAFCAIEEWDARKRREIGSRAEGGRK